MTPIYFNIDGNYGCVQIYNNYIINLIKKYIYSHPILTTKDISIGINSHQKYDYNFSINYEHTLVKDGGRNLDINCPYSKIKDSDGKNYRLRIVDLERLINSNLVFDYSNVNIHNIVTSEHYPLLVNKLIYIPPLIFPYSVENNNKTIDILTTYIDVNQERRRIFFERCREENINITNVSNIFLYEDMLNLMKKTKIIINLHQTDHHHTFEELRALPALLCGVIVISEETPVKEKIPYNEFIIWTDYDNIQDKIIEVSNNYEYYYNKIFKNNLLKEVIKNMENNMYIELYTKLYSIIHN